MALGIGKKGAARLGVNVSDIEEIEHIATMIKEGWYMSIDMEEYPRTKAWITQCYHLPSRDELIMSMLDERLDGCGVEPIRIEGSWVDKYHMDIVASYVNFGDTYATTVVLDHRTGRFIVTSWGDYVESRGY